MPVSDMAGQDADETLQLQQLFSDAFKFIDSFHWVEKVETAHFGLGVADIIGVFLFEIAPAREGIPKFLWVIVGDVPPAYLVVDDASTPNDALRLYIREMRAWVQAVLANERVEDAIPVNVPPTAENAEDLKVRLSVLEDEILDRDLPPPDNR